MNEPVPAEQSPSRPSADLDLAIALRATNSRVLTSSAIAPTRARLGRFCSDISVLINMMSRRDV